MINIKKVRPMFTSIIVTKDKYGVDDVPQGALVNAKQIQGALKEYQTVIAVGHAVREVKVGEVVMIDPRRYAKYKPYKAGDGMRDGIEGKEREIIGYDIPSIEIDGKEYLVIEENDVSFVIEESETVKDSAIIIPGQKIIGV